MFIFKVIIDRYPCDFAYMENLQKKINEQTKKKQTHRYREHLIVAKWEWGWGMGEKGEEIKMCKLPVIKMVIGI